MILKTYNLQNLGWLILIEEGVLLIVLIKVPLFCSPSRDALFIV